MKIAIIDNYDSFVYNLIRYIREDENVKETIVYRNDEVDFKKLKSVDGILLSPGPGIPEEAGDLIKIIDTFKNEKSILGVCLGHQAIAQKLEKATKILHGKESEIEIDNSTRLFKGLENRICVGRYHSWQVKANELPAEFKVTAKDLDNNIMGIEHESLRLYGVQFHPESILTPKGRIIINNWITTCKTY